METKNMAKKPTKGRPKGEKREPINITMLSTRAQKLRELAVKQKETVSGIIETALTNEYGI